MSVLHDLVDTGSYIGRIRELLVGGENPNIQDAEGQTPLHIAVMKCERDPQILKETLLVVRELIDFGANTDQKDDIGCTPLHFAVMCRQYELVEMLLQANGNINKKDNSGWAALHYATVRCTFLRIDGTLSLYYPNVRLVNLLLRYHPDLDIRNQNNETPLMLAVRNNELCIIRALLNKNASTNLQDLEGNSIMHYALDAPEVDVDVVLELVRQGCSFIAKNRHDKTPLDSYVEKLLLNHPLTEVEKAKQVIKTFMLSGYHLSRYGKKCLRLIDQENESVELLPYLFDCYHEIIKMQNHELTSKYTVSNIAARGAFSRNFENEDPIHYTVFDKVLYELIEGRYPAYCDVIAAGICKRYMNKKFAKMCCSTQTGIEFLYFDVLYLVSFYLSQFEMVNMMIACSIEERHSPDVQCFTNFKRCCIL